MAGLTLAANCTIRARGHHISAKGIEVGLIKEIGAAIADSDGTEVSHSPRIDQSWTEWEHGGGADNPKRPVGGVVVGQHVEVRGRTV